MITEWFYSICDIQGVPQKQLMVPEQSNPHIVYEYHFFYWHTLYNQYGHLKELDVLLKDR